MPAKANPKKQAEKQKKREEEKFKQKVIEDKTFGLKNKNKSASVQKYIKGVKTQVTGVNKGGESAKLAQEHAAKEEKKKAKVESALLASLFKSVVEIPKVDDANAKTVICPYFKQGFCKKGDKCKFSHDLSGEPIQLEKPDLYTDTRTCHNDITCQFFLEAVESNKFGWFWKCPNGDTCIYKHALPEGYVIKSEEEKALEMAPEEDELPIEYKIEEERTALPPGGVPVTLEIFMKWISEQKEMREQAKAEENRKLGRISGKAMFMMDQSLFKDDEGAFEEYVRDQGIEQEGIEVDTGNKIIDEGGNEQEENKEEEIVKEEGEKEEGEKDAGIIEDREPKQEQIIEEVKEEEPPQPNERVQEGENINPEASQENAELN
ncbi:unnamed protein product [Blepharisma stoltei]|uniref:C3H1-type domain-containing protein n=1 Tax=Blepharisma stoltei TaxID=1481888 RepID=A0AAU9K529_9CILI|nr:unnamed protein product [Blepharisma stoltei]